MFFESIHKYFKRMQVLYMSYIINVTFKLFILNTNNNYV